MDIFSHPARVYSPLAPPDAALMERIRAAAADPTIFDTRAPYTFAAEISSSRMDAYYTRMSSKTTLRNFAADADAGVSFQDSHRHDALGFGRSVAGAYLAANADTGEPPRVQATFFTIPGLALNGVDTGHLIDGIRAGIVKDVSVGFYGGTFVCSICGRDMLRDWDCPHIPGIEYPVRSDDGDSPGEAVTKLAFAWIEDAHLAEVSAVYEGATPGAAIIKANQEAAAGRIRPDTAYLIEARYRVHLPDRRVLVPGGLPKDIHMHETTTESVAEDRAAPVAPPAAPQPTDDTRVADLTRQLDETTRALADARAEVARLAPLADDGRAYRSDLVEQAIAEGIRAYGNAFPVETYREILAGLSLDGVKRIRDLHADAARAAIPTGRQSADRTEPPAPRPTPTVPDAAFAA